MTPQKSIAIEPELLERAGKVAEAEGKTVDEFANEVVRRELLRRSLRTFVDGNRTDAEAMGLAEADVARLVAEDRAERRR